VASAARGRAGGDPEQTTAARLIWGTTVRYLQAVGLPEDPGLHDLVARSEALNRILSLWLGPELGQPFNLPGACPVAPHSQTIHSPSSSSAPSSSSPPWCSWEESSQGVEEVGQVSGVGHDRGS